MTEPHYRSAAVVPVSVCVAFFVIRTPLSIKFFQSLNNVLFSIVAPEMFMSTEEFVMFMSVVPVIVVTHAPD